MAKSTNRAWNLEAFLDSLTLELDRARDTLAVKGINQPMTYSVKDLSLDLQLFPTFDGKEVRFVTAQPGETGASKVSISLSSISDRQIRQTTRPPAKEDDLSLQEIEEIDDETKSSLEKIGIRRVSDLEKLEAEKVNLNEVTATKTPEKKDLQSIADRLKELRGIKSRQKSLLEQKDMRKKYAPNLSNISFKRVGDFLRIHLQGKRLRVSQEFEPQVFLNGKNGDILLATPEEVVVQVLGSYFDTESNDFRLVLDEHSILKLNLK